MGIEEVHRYSLEQYHRLIEMGGFDEDERVELLEGLLVVMTPKTPRHEGAAIWLARWLIEGVDASRYEVGVGRPLTIGSSEPEPDLTVVARDAPRPYHPATATLVIEISVSSLARDLGLKAEIYAAAEVSEYWVVDLEGGRLVVHRQPGERRYGVRFDVAAGQSLEASALPLSALNLDDLLRAGGS